jgi:hypothetical protein
VYVSPRTAGIATAALNHFTGNTFLKEMRRTVTGNETPLETKEIINDGVHPVMKEIVINQKQ